MEEVGGARLFGAYRPSSYIAAFPLTTNRYGVRCPVDKARTDVEFAIAYGRNCRKVFGGEAWNVAIHRIRVTWETIPVDIDWEIALPLIRAGWHLAQIERPDSAP